MRTNITSRFDIDLVVLVYDLFLYQVLNAFNVFSSKRVDLTLLTFN